MIVTPMLAESASEKMGKALLQNDLWTAEQKMDGVRIILHVDNGEVTPVNRRGVRTTVPLKVTKEFQSVPGNWAFDGELVKDEFYVFDLPVAGKLISPASPFHERRAALDGIFNSAFDLDSPVHLLPCAKGTDEKMGLHAVLWAGRAEGLMLKHADGVYVPGKRSQKIRKLKFVKTVDAIISRLGIDGKENAALALVEDGKVVEVGKCSMIGKPTCDVGDVVEVRYLYATDDRRLYQPCLLRKRNDKAMYECTIDQLIYTNKSAVL